MKYSNHELISAVRSHAEENYELSCWSWVVEAFSDEDIWREIQGARTPAGAIKKMKKWVALKNEMRSNTY